MGCVWMLLSLTAITRTLRMSWNVQPVSSYGAGFCGE
jgi:hypothetical protein